MSLTKTQKQSFKRAYSFFIPLCLWAVIAAGAVISVANDMYAFVKPQKSITVDISTPKEVEKLSKLLEEAEVIDNPFMFSLYVRSKGKEETVEKCAGSLELDSSMSYREILLAIAEKNSLSKQTTNE